MKCTGATRGMASSRCASAAEWERRVFWSAWHDDGTREQGRGMVVGIGRCRVDTHARAPVGRASPDRSHLARVCGQGSHSGHRPPRAERLGACATSACSARASSACSALTRPKNSAVSGSIRPLPSSSAATPQEARRSAPPSVRRATSRSVRSSTSAHPIRKPDIFPG